MVIKVKKRFLLYGITICLGIILAFIFYYKIDDSLASVIDNRSVTVFQLGVFKNIDNAKEFISNNHIGYLFYDGEYYRVYAGITIDNIKLNEEYLESLNLNYYEKKLSVNKEFYNLVKEYDSLTKSTNKLSLTNQDLIESYLESTN